MTEPDVKSEIMRLAQERARAGKPPMADAEILDRWKRIRDGALAWLEQSVLYAKGVKEAEQLYNRACREIAQMERRIR